MKVIIVHGWDFKPKHNWYPWLAEELSSKGHEVIVPEMPDTDVPTIDAWVHKIGQEMSSLNNTQDIILVGHSIGTQAIMRYLATSGNKVAGIVLVGAWITLDEQLLADEGEEVQEIAKPWLETPIDFKTITSCVLNRIVILSDNDYYVPFTENKKLFEEKLNAKIITEHDNGHFTYDDGITELPSVLSAVLEIANQKTNP